MTHAEDVFHLGIKGLIRNAAGEILLLKVNLAKLHNTADAYWDIPGGRVQRGDSPETTLRREIEEELGVSEVTDIKPLTMVLSNIRIPLDASDVGLILAVYTCKLPTDAAIVLSEEHTEFAWYAPREAAKLLAVKYPETFTSQIAALA